MSPISRTLAGFAVAAVLSSPAGAQGIVSQKNITLALAQTIANAAIAQCRSMGYKISVTVVDREGLPIVMMRDDGAGLTTPEGSDRKAYTARAFSQPSAECRAPLPVAMPTLANYGCARRPLRALLTSSTRLWRSDTRAADACVSSPDSTRPNISWRSLSDRRSGRLVHWWLPDVW